MLQLAPVPATERMGEVGRWGLDVGFGWGSIIFFIPRHRTLLSVGSSVASCSVCHHAIRNGPALFGPPSPAPMRCACGVCLCVPPCPPACYCSCKPSTLVSVPVVSYASSHCSSVSAHCPSVVSSRRSTPLGAEGMGVKCIPGYENCISVSIVIYDSREIR